jgi:hypothetical protein
LIECARNPSERSADPDRPQGAVFLVVPVRDGGWHLQATLAALRRSSFGDWELLWGWRERDGELA